MDAAKFTEQAENYTRLVDPSALLKNEVSISPIFTLERKPRSRFQITKIFWQLKI
jgi:hypothetical protein